MGFLERDEAAGELEQGEVVLVVFGPADEDGAVAVQPGVGGLDDPPPRAPVGFADACGELLATRADVRREAVLDRERADRRGVVGAVQAQPLLRRRGRFGALDRDRLDRRG